METHVVPACVQQYGSNLRFNRWLCARGVETSDFSHSCRPRSPYVDADGRHPTLVPMETQTPPTPGLFGKHIWSWKHGADLIGSSRWHVVADHSDQTPTQSSVTCSTNGHLLVQEERTEPIA